MSISLIDIDIAKNVFQLHGVDYAGNVKLRKRVLRAKLIKTIAQIEPSTIVMEACGGANHWSRQLSKFGHQVKLISPQYVKPFVK
jgi:transposase